MTHISKIYKKLECYWSKHILFQKKTDYQQAQSLRVGFQECYSGADLGGGGAGGGGFYSGFRKKSRYTLVASEKKNTRGGVQFEILRNPGIDFYSGLEKIHFYSGFRDKKNKGGCNSKS